MQVLCEGTVCVPLHFCRLEALSRLYVFSSTWRGEQLLLQQLRLCSLRIKLAWSAMHSSLASCCGESCFVWILSLFIRGCLFFVEPGIVQRGKLFSVDPLPFSSVAACFFVRFCLNMCCCAFN